MSLQLHRPDGKGGLQPTGVENRNWRSQLRSPRWGASLRGGRLPAMRNPEMNPTPTAPSLLLWLTLGIITFIALVLGYGPLGLWELGSA